MGRAPCCDKQGLRKGPWSPEEDKILIDYIHNNGLGSWRSLPKLAGLLRCGKSCRLRWTNYLRPDIKRGPFTSDEQKSIIQLHGIVGNKWSTIAAQLPGRTDNEIKNYWNTHLKKRLLRMGINPETYSPSFSPTSVVKESSVGAGGGPESGAAPPSSSATRHMAQWESARLEAEARHSRESAIFSTSGAAAAASPGHSGVSEPGKLDADFFLRIWNSEVGEAFRSKEATSSATRISPASSSTKCSSSQAHHLTMGIKKEEIEVAKLCEVAAGGSSVCSDDGEPNKEDVEYSKSSVSTCIAGGLGSSNAGNAADSSSSNEVEGTTTSEETYQMYLNFMGEDMEQLGHLFQGGLDSLSLFGSGDTNEPSLDMPFK